MSTPHPPFKVKTIVSWAGEEDGDLGFIENEVIEVFSIVDESWWSGKLRRNNAEGIFPRDYVEILEEKLSHSSSNISLTTPKQTTPQKDQDNYRNSKGYYSASKNSPTRVENLNDPDSSFDYDSGNYTIDAIETNPRLSSSANYQAKKLRSSNNLMSSMNHPKFRQSNHHQQEDSDRQKEIAHFKQLQQQQNYQIRKASQNHQEIQQKRMSLQYPDNSNNNSFSKSKRSSQIYSSQDPQSPSSRGLKTSSYIDLSHQSSNNKLQPLFNNYTVESFSPEATSPRQSNRRKPDNAHFESYQEIAERRAQLEMELQRLKEIERSTQKQKSNRSPVGARKNISSDLTYDASIESYVSEDLHSSKRYASKDDLGKKLSRRVSDEEEDLEDDEDTEPSPPPPPPKHATPISSRDVIREQYVGNSQFKQSTRNKVPFDADDFGVSGNSIRQPMSDEELYRLSQMQQEDLKNSLKSMQSDVLNLSELSATSAGSFYRHKYEREITQQQQALKGLSIESEPVEERSASAVMESMFDKKAKQSNIFKKLLQKKAPEENLIEQKLQKESEIDWTTHKIDLNRMNSLTSQDKQLRTKRVLREDPSLVVKPLDFISDINMNEVTDSYDTDYVLKPSIDKVDAFMELYNTEYDLNELISDISVKFNSSKLNQVRCVLIHLCKFEIIEESGKISQVKPKLAEVQANGEATIYQLNYLFKKILDALRIPSEIILGFWKKPNEFYHNEQFVNNHSWLSILVDEQFLLLDLYNFKNGSVCNIRNNPQGYNEFYFLAKPLTLVSTHIPSVIDLQHVIPPIDPNIAFYLPRSYSGFYEYNLKFRNFNNSLTRLNDLEFFELELDIPQDVELFTLVKTSKITTNDLSLSQVIWHNNKRIAKIKAILPPNESIGVLQIFAGPKGLQKHFDNIHQLAAVIPIYHTGNFKDCKFVPRFPTVQSQNNDLYIKQPQVSKIIVKNSYNFEIDQYPSMGLNNGSGLMNQDFKLVIESPSGKYFKLNKSDPIKPYGTYHTNIKCQEVGLYRGLVIGDSGNSWYVFAQWECVQGTVTN
ncbi:hypothetical protein DFJ63DRAFT_163055 [Scheffersomyces coipomensis]|uniref:uncharacterized protein n=1 Tax=Scheffersomyces coipomensis TaxID=1788519 RepID=UPI00315DE255